MIRLWTYAAASALLAAGMASAENEPFRLEMCSDNATRGWSFYCSPPPVEEEVEEEVAAPAPPPPTPAEPEYPATEEMMRFRKMVDELRHRAVMDPTEENVLAYMEVNKLIADKAGDFTEQWQRILFGTPHLNANVDYPLASAGVGVYQDQLKAVREDTFKTVANEAGIMFLFEGDDRCGICRVQGEVLAGMEQFYGVTIFGVSMDGGTNEFFPGAVVDNGRLAELGLADYPAPTLALVHPESGEIAVMGSGLITADQILERVHVITAIPEGERY